MVAVVPRTAAGFAEGVPEEVVDAVQGAGALASRLGALARSQLHRGGIEALRSCEVTHYPFTVPIPTARRGGPVVQTLHDVQHRDLPALFSTAERAYRAVMYDRGARRADAVVTISAFGRERAIATLGLDPAKVHVAPLGVEPVDAPGHGGGRFVLYPARAWPHKNHARLVAAMQQVRVRRPELRLVLTGGGLDGLGDLPDWSSAGATSRMPSRPARPAGEVLGLPEPLRGVRPATVGGDGAGVSGGVLAGGRTAGGVRDAAVL